MALEEGEVLAKVEELLARASADSDFEAQLARDPWGTAETEGITRADTAAALSLPADATDDEVAEALRARVAQTDWGRKLPDEILDEVP
jgi:hypothetical protein